MPLNTAPMKRRIAPQASATGNLCAPDGIDTAGRPRTTAHQPPPGPRTACDKPVRLDRLDGVARTGRVKAAAVADETPERQLVEADQEDREAGGGTPDVMPRA